MKLAHTFVVKRTQSISYMCVHVCDRQKMRMGIIAYRDLYQVRICAYAEKSVGGKNVPVDCCMRITFPSTRDQWNYFWKTFRRWWQNIPHRFRLIAISKSNVSHFKALMHVQSYHKSLTSLFFSGHFHKLHSRNIPNSPNTNGSTFKFMCLIASGETTKCFRQVAFHQLIDAVGLRGAGFNMLKEKR